MNRWRFLAFFLTLLFVASPLVLPPALALAQPTHFASTGLVPCGAVSASNPYGATQCGLCDFSVLIQNIINYLIVLALPLSAALFAWAGILLFTAGDNTENRGKAKSIFVHVCIGLLITLAGYLVVQTVLNALVQRSPLFPSGFSFSFGQCASDNQDGSNNGRPRSTPITQLFSPLGNVSVAPGALTPAGTAAGSGGSSVVQGSIASAAAAYINTNTSAGPDGGNKACAWAVNNVLVNAGLPAIDGNSVQSMENALQAGAGTLVDQSNAQAGDIIIQSDDKHVGICQNAGCSSVISNSSSHATFTNTTTLVGRIYQVNH